MHKSSFDNIIVIWIGVRDLRVNIVAHYGVYKPHGCGYQLPQIVDINVYKYLQFVNIYPYFRFFYKKKKKSTF